MNREIIIYGFVFLHILSSETLVLSATIFQEDFTSSFLEDRCDSSFQGKESRVLLAYKGLGIHKVAAPQLWNKPTICAASHWVSSTPHPWDWVLKGKGCENVLGDGRHGWSISGLFLLLFHFNRWIYFEEVKKKGREGKEKNEDLTEAWNSEQHKLSLVIQGELVLRLIYSYTQIPKSVDAQVPYIIWCSICVWVMHILLYIFNHL